MSGAGNAREADRGGQCICRERNPAVPFVSFGDYGRDGKRRCSMAGRKTSSMKRRLATNEKGVFVIAAGRDVDGPLSARDRLYREVGDDGISVGFGAEKG